MTKSKVDQSVMKLLKKVREKKEKIEKAKKRPRWKTNCIVGIDNRTVNIQTVRDEDKILDACSSLIGMKDLFGRSAKLLGLEFDGLYDGYPIDEWIEDLKTRVGMLNLEKEKKELEELDRRVNKLVTSEQRREMELLELEKILSD